MTYYNHVNVLTNFEERSWEWVIVAIMTLLNLYHLYDECTEIYEFSYSYFNSFLNITQFTSAVLNLIVIVAMIVLLKDIADE